MVRAVVVDHVSIRGRDLEPSRRFYETTLAPLGFGVLYSDEGGCSFGLQSADKGADDFWILEGYTPSTNGHVAFAAADRDAVDAFHRAALRADGTTALRDSVPSTTPVTTAPLSSTPTATISRRCIMTGRDLSSK